MRFTLSFGGDELEEGGLCSLGVLVDGRACHDGASKLVEGNEGALGATIIGSITFAKNNTVCSKGFSKAFGDKGIVLNVLVSGR